MDGEMDGKKGKIYGLVSEDGIRWRYKLNVLLPHTPRMIRDEMLVLTKQMTRLEGGTN